MSDRPPEVAAAAAAGAGVGVSPVLDWPPSLLPPPSNACPSFAALMALAVDTNAAIRIQPGAIIELEETITIKRHSASLHIFCNNDENDEDDTCSASGKRPMLIGRGHSIFKLAGKNVTLILEGVTLSHQRVQEDHREQGAAVFAMNSSRAYLSYCTLQSKLGFCVWGVQRAMVDVKHCILSSEGRSACVFFGSSCLTMTNSIVRDCKIHGVCSRGMTKLVLRQCHFLNNMVRALYGYHSVDILLEECCIQGTQSADHASVEVMHSTPQEYNADIEGFQAVDGAGNAKPIHSADPVTVLDANSHASDLRPHRHEDAESKQSGNSSTSDRLVAGSKLHVYQDGQGHKKALRGITRCIIHRSQFIDNAGVAVKVSAESVAFLEFDCVESVFRGNRRGDIQRIHLEAEGGCRGGNGPRGLQDRHRASGGREASAVLAAPLCPDTSHWYYEIDDAGGTSSNEARPDTGWRAYDMQTSLYLEKEYQSYLIVGEPADVPLPNGGERDGIAKRCVNFGTMIQTNLDTFFMRSIRRREGAS